MRHCSFRAEVQQQALIYFVHLQLLGVGSALTLEFYKELQRVSIKKLPVREPSRPVADKSVIVHDWNVQHRQSISDFLLLLVGEVSHPGISQDNHVTVTQGVVVLHQLEVDRSAASIESEPTLMAVEVVALA